MTFKFGWFPIFNVVFPTVWMDLRQLVFIKTWGKKQTKLERKGLLEHEVYLFMLLVEYNS